MPAHAVTVERGGPSKTQIVPDLAQKLERQRKLECPFATGFSELSSYC